MLYKKTKRQLINDKLYQDFEKTILDCSLDKEDRFRKRYNKTISFSRKSFGSSGIFDSSEKNSFWQNSTKK